MHTLYCLGSLNQGYRSKTISWCLRISSLLPFSLWGKKAYFMMRGRPGWKLWTQIVPIIWSFQWGRLIFVTRRSALMILSYPIAEAKLTPTCRIPNAKTIPQDRQAIYGAEETIHHVRSTDWLAPLTGYLGADPGLFSWRHASAPFGGRAAWLTYIWTAGQAEDYGISSSRVPEKRQGH